MIKYIKIVKYMAGDSINKQIQDIIDNGMMDKDTRLFFDRGNCLTMGILNHYLRILTSEAIMILTMWYLYQKTTSLRDLLKMGKVLTIKNGKNAWQLIQDVIVYSQ